MSLDTGITQTALDSRGLAELRYAAGQDNKNNDETLEKVAGQFEAIFMNMMLKSMRQASLADGIFDSSQSDTYQDMADQQLSIDISSRGGLGLKEVIMRQLGKQAAEKIEGTRVPESISAQTLTKRSIRLDVDREQLLAAAHRELPELLQSAAISEQSKLSFDSPESFVRQLWSMAEKAARKIGVTPEVILSQAALETGWGQHVIHKNTETSSHNLFNIKADERWQGDSAAIGTVEYRDGLAVKEQAKFRVYNSYQESFDDYIQFLQTQPRYREALKQTKDPEAFIDGLHKAGYATDPAYADKIKRIMNSDTLTMMSTQLGSA
ncbi:MAG: flagellar protein FlgJ [Methylophagaceae bacterium]|jgi:flagellar protein FlgJ